MKPEAASWFRGRQAVVTGGTGFIGSHLTRALVDAGCAVTVLARPGSQLGRIADLASRIRVVHCDLTAHDALEPLDPAWASDLIFHLAAAGTTHTHAETPDLMEVNLHGTLRLLAWARGAKTARFIHAGSCAEYGMGIRVAEDQPLAPRTPYGLSKAMATVALQAHGRSLDFPTVTLRLFSPFGPAEEPQRLIAHTILRALEGRDVALTTGDQTRDFVFVHDVTDAFLQAAAAPDLRGDIFNVCTGRETRVRDIASTVLRLMGNPVRLLVGALPQAAGEPGRISGNPDHAQQRLHWQAETSLEDALRQTIQWFSQAHKQGTLVPAADAR